MDIQANGELTLILPQLLWREDAKNRSGEVHIILRRRDGIWDREAELRAPSFHASLSYVSMTVQDPEAAILEWEFAGRINPEPWCPYGGLMRGQLTFSVPENVGEYTAEHRGETITGGVTARFQPDLPASRGLSADEPEILRAWRRDGGSGRLYDYSRAGYHYGEEPPLAPELPLFTVTDFGARPDSGEDCRAAAQATIDAAAAAGGGIVYFPAGRYDFSVHDKQPCLEISTSRIVLRGAGSGPDGTVFVNHRYSDSPQPAQPWLAGLWPGFIHVGPARGDILYERKSAAGPAIARVVAGQRGACEIRVDDASVLRPGSTLLLRHLEDTAGSLARHLVQNACDPAGNYVGEGRPLVSQLLTIVEVTGDRVSVDLPLHFSVGPWVCELAELELLEEIGIEHLRMRSHWRGYFEHHLSPEHDNGWDHIKMALVQNGWMRNLIHENTTSASGFKDCKNCTSMDQRIVGNMGHNGFVVGGLSSACLNLRLDAGRQMHGFNVQSTMCGNVFLDCHMDEGSGLDLHGGIGLDNLFDNLLGGINAGGGGPGAVPPRHAAGLTFWNCLPGIYDPYMVWRRKTVLADTINTPGYIAVGCAGRYDQLVDFEGPDGLIAGEIKNALVWIESRDRPVKPRSLYIEQVSARNGQAPAYLFATV